MTQMAPPICAGIIHARGEATAGMRKEGTGPSPRAGRQQRGQRVTRLPTRIIPARGEASTDAIVGPTEHGIIPARGEATTNAELARWSQRDHPLAQGGNR